MIGCRDRSMKWPTCDWTAVYLKHGVQDPTSNRTEEGFQIDALSQFRDKILPNSHFAKYKIAEWFFAEKLRNAPHPDFAHSQSDSDKKFQFVIPS